MSAGLPIVAWTPIRHQACCARHDPTPGPCDCDAGSNPLVSAATAEALVARLNARIAQLQGTADEYNAWVRFHDAGNGDFRDFLRQIAGRSREGDKP